MSNYLDNIDVIDANNEVINVLLQDRETLALANLIRSGEVIANASVYGVQANSDITDTLTSLFNSFKYLYLPEGTYEINGLVIPNGCGIIGNNAIITSDNNPCIRLNSNSFIDGLTISNSNSDTYSNCIDTANGAENVRISNCNISGCYIEVYLNHVKKGVIYNTHIENSFTNGLCIYASGCEQCLVDTCEIIGNYTSGSHCVQFSDGKYNTVRHNHITDAYNFNISFYNEINGCIANNICEDSRVESINLDNSDQCEVHGNSCLFTNTDRPNYDHGITIFGSTKSANFNHVHHNLVVKAHKAGIAIAGIAGLNTIEANVIRQTNSETGVDSIKGAIVIYKDASVPQTAPFQNIIANNIFSDVPYYGIEERDGYQNVATGNMSVPYRANYLTHPIYQICDDVCITPITPEPTITSTATVVNHEEFWNGEFIEGTFVIDAVANTAFTFSIGIEPAANNMFDAHVNANADFPISIDASGIISATPTYSGNVQINYRYKASKFFS